ncbi:MAG: porin [bacterium]
MGKEYTLRTVFICVLLACALSFAGRARAEKLEIGGTIDVDLFGGKQKNTDTSSDLKLDLFELSIDSELDEHVSAHALVNYEYEGGDEEESYNLVVDEAYLTLSKLVDQPLTIMAGKWYLPFGVFNNHLTTDPLTQDAYEINAPAVSFIFALEEIEGVDVSVTGYSSREARFADPNLAEPENDFGNYMVNASFAPGEFLKMSVYFDSEQGVNDRNDSLGASLSAAYQDSLTFDAEYIKALERDQGRSKDSAYSISGAFKPQPELELVGRFEGYDDGVDGYQDYDPDSLVGVEYRVSAGINYELHEHVTLMSEYRVTEVEDADVSNVKDWTLRLRLEF